MVVLSAAAFLWTCWYSRTAAHPSVRLDEWHHLYLGLLVAGVALVSRRPGLLLIAAVISVDDAWQHLRHVAGAVDYMSPLHHLFARLLWPLEPVQVLTGWLDRLLG